MSIIIESLLQSLSATVKEGKVYEVGHVHRPGIPHHPGHPPFLYSMARAHNDVTDGVGVSGANDIFTMGTHTGTHMDAIGHFSCDGNLHGGIVADDVQEKHSGLKEHGIDAAVPVLKKAVLLDVAKYKGVDHLEAAYSIGADDLSGTMDNQGVSIEQGDAVLIRTGWNHFYKEPRKYVSPVKGAPGINEEGARWLINQGMGLVGADTIAVEVMPNQDMPVHRMILVDNGIHIIEVLDLEEIAQDNVYQFLFICLPLRIVGATGSPIRPIAIC